MAAGAGSPSSRDVVRNSAVLAAAKVLERATGFAISVLVASALGADGLGVYATAWAVYGLLWTIGDAGATEYLIRAVSRDPARTGTYTVHLSIVALGAASVLVLGGQLIVPHLGYSDELETSVRIVLLALLPRVVNTIQEAVFIAHGRVRYETWTRLVSSTVYVGSAAVLLHRGAPVHHLLTALVVIEYVVALTYFALITRCIARLRLRFRRSLAVQLVSDMRWFTASTALAALFARPEIIILSLVSSERQVGLYGAALRLAELPLLLSEAFNRSVYPRLAHSFGRSEDEFHEWQRFSVRAMHAYALPVAALVFVTAPELVQLVFGDGFAGAATPLRILSTNVVVLSLISVHWRLLAARDRQRSNVLAQAGAVTVELGAGVALAVAFGAVGAALSNVGASTVYLLLLLAATRRSGARSAVLATGWRFAASAGLAGAASGLLLTAVPLALAVAAGSTAYLALVFLTGAATSRDREVVSRLWRRHREGSVSAR